MRVAPIAGAALVIGIAAASVASCSLGGGHGDVSGFLNVRDCWVGSFDLQPDFFAAVPYRHSLQLRIQNGGDYQTFSDGVSILIDDVFTIRGGELNKPLDVSLPPGVTPPGVPITPNPNPGQVHLALYLQRTCRTQNVALYALDTVSLANGCGGPGDAGAAEPQVCGDSGASTEAGTPSAGAGSGAALGHSTITFNALFNNNVEEANADERFNEGTFDVYLADPRELCPGGLGPPPPCRGHVKGTFRFYFERGRPAQPFP